MRVFIYFFYGERERWGNKTKKEKRKSDVMEKDEERSTLKRG